MRKYEEFLKCDYSPAEMAEMATDLARSNQCRGSLEQQKKQIDSQLKSQIEEQNTIIGRLSSALVSRCEWRNVECRVELDTPQKGLKRIVRIDTGEEVRVILMTDEDRQMALDLQSEAEAAAQKEEEEKAQAERDKVIVTPPPVLASIEAPAVAEVMSAAEVEAEGAPLASAAVMGTGTHQKKRGKQAAAGDTDAS